MQWSAYDLNLSFAHVHLPKFGADMFTRALVNNTIHIRLYSSAHAWMISDVLEMPQTDLLIYDSPHR